VKKIVSSWAGTVLIPGIRFFHSFSGMGTIGSGQSPLRNLEKRIMDRFVGRIEVEETERSFEVILDPLDHRVNRLFIVIFDEIDGVI
jgi:hypothetical protein